MTVVTIQLKDVGLAADVGPIVFRAPRVRGDGAGGVTTTQEHTVTLDADGRGEVTLSPGPVRVSWEGYSRTCDVPESGEIIAWDIGQAVQPGDLRTHDGQTWRAKIDHVTHEGWAPSPAAHAVWKLV